MRSILLSKVSTATPSNGTPSKQSPSTTRRDQASKTVITTSSTESTDTIKPSPVVTTAKTVVSPTEQATQPIITPSRRSKTSTIHSP